MERDPKLITIAKKTNQGEKGSMSISTVEPLHSEETLEGLHRLWSKAVVRLNVKYTPD